MGIQDLIDEQLALKRQRRNATQPLYDGAAVLPGHDDPRVAKAIREDIEALATCGEGQRNSELNRTAGNLGRLPIDRNELRQLLLDACQRNGLASDDGIMQCEKTIDSGFAFADREGPRIMPPLNSNGGVFNGHTPDFIEAEDIPPPDLTGLPELEEDFWERPSLRLIWEAALGRMCAPWSVLAQCAAMGLALVRPHVTLPPIIGGPGSLNWFALVVARSGGGKGASSAVARELISDEVYVRNLGSGEGMIGAFQMPPVQGQPPAQRESVMFSTDEVDVLGAMAGRNGSTTMSVLRQAYSGETLGFSYITRGRDIHIPAGQYRATLVISAQPGRCRAILGDHVGGTPQRFMWFPGSDPRIDIDHYREQVWPITLPSNREWLYPRQIGVPDVVRREILEERVANMRGETDAISGHLMYTREKFAFALAVLDGRTEMTEDDWRLSGVAMNVSEATRLWVEHELEKVETADAEAAGRLRGVEQGAADEARRLHDVKRAVRIEGWLLRKIDKLGPSTIGALRRAATSADRPWVSAAVQQLAERGVLRVDGFNQWHINKEE